MKIKDFFLFLSITLFTLVGCSSNHEGEINYLQNQINGLEGQSNDYKSALDEKEAQILNLNNQVKDLEDEIQNLKAEQKYIKFSFESSECNESINPYDDSNLGITKTGWIDENTLEIEAYVTINCAERILDGNFEINKNKIMLKYDHTHCTICTSCMCANKLTYKFQNIEKKEYEFEI